MSVHSVLDGTLIGQGMKRHRHREFLRFLRILDRQAPRPLDLHLIVDNTATQKHAKVKKGLEMRARFHIHFAPRTASWLI